MNIQDELNNWEKHEYSYITKSYKIVPLGDKKEIELYYNYAKNSINIRDTAKLGVSVDYNLTEEDLHGFFNEADNKFFKQLQKHITETWEQTIEDNRPAYGEIIDVAFYYPQIDNSGEQMKINGTVLITNGKKVGGNIVSDDGGVNFELERGNVSIIGWSPK